MTAPDFFIVGAPRAGTTAMTGWLRQHPQIFIPPVKEMHFFGADILSASPFRDREKYLAEFQPGRGYKRVGEASVWYLFSKKAAAEIKDFNPDGRIIIMLRNPVDMIYSLHAKLLLIGDENIENFQQALDAEPDRKKQMALPGKDLPMSPLFYREHARLSEHVKRYLDVFGRDRVHVIIFDEIQSDAAGGCRRVLEFLEVDPGFTPELESANEHRKARSMALHRFLQNPPPFLWTLRRLLLPENFHLGGKLMRLNAPAEKRPPLEPRLRTTLEQEFRPEIEKLEKLLGRDLAIWSRT